MKFQKYKVRFSVCVCVLHEDRHDFQAMCIIHRTRQGTTRLMLRLSQWIQGCDEAVEAVILLSKLKTYTAVIDLPDNNCTPRNRMMVSVK